MILVSMETQDVIACMLSHAAQTELKLVENVCCAQCVRCACMTTERVTPVFSVVRIRDHTDVSLSCREI